MSIKKRRIINSIILIGSSIIVYLINKIFKISLVDAARYSGFLLIGLVFFLTLFNARKKFPGIPLLKVSTWTQIHIYLGFFCVFIFFLHIDFSLPNGIFEISLALIFLAVAVSGVIGLIITRWLPRHMIDAGEPLIYEMIPTYRRKVLEEVKELVLQAERELKSSTIGDLYVNSLITYFQNTPGILQAFFLKAANYRNAIESVRSNQRYMDTDETKYSTKLLELLKIKRNIDIQDSSQRLLKKWLFIHIPLSYSLIILSLVHAFFALRYS